MVIAQVVLVTPIVAAVARQIVEDLWRQYAELYLFDGAGRVRTICSLLWLGRLSLMTAILAGAGRATPAMLPPTIRIAPTSATAPAR
jgi:tungstate transport system permease protein